MGVIAKIVEVIAPESAATDELIMIGARSHNEGDTGDIFVRFVDRDTGEMIPVVVSHNVEYCLSPGGAGQIAMPPKNWNLRLEVGEGYPTNPISITDTQNLIILNPEYPPPKPSIIKTLAVTLGPIVVGAIISRRR